MLVTLKIYYYDIFGKGLIDLNLDDNATVREALEELNRKFGERFEKKLV